MKNLISYKLILISLLFAGCQENFLEEPTSSIIDPGNAVNKQNRS
jgi:hypothetical protein